MLEIKLNKIYTENINDVAITIGNDKVSTEFQSHVKMRFWDEDEIWIEPLFVDKTIPTEKDGMITQIISNGKYQWRRIGDDLKWEMYIETKPLTNTYTLKIGGNWQDFNFNYQTPFKNPVSVIEDGEEYLYEYNLTNAGVYDKRHCKVDGSYSVYHKTKKNNKYKTGKAFHIYVPKITDALGKVFWTKLDIKDDVYTVTLDDNAVYPIVINDTFGITSVGGSTGALGDNWMLAADGIPTGGDGVVDSIHAWNHTGSGTNITGGIYEMVKNPANLVDGYSTAEGQTVSAGWIQLDFSSKPAVVDSTTYLIAVHIGSGVNWASRYDVNAGKGAYDNDNTYNGGVMPDGFLWDSIDYGRDISIYATYTPSAGGDDYVRTFNDSMGLDSSLTKAAAYTRTESENIALSDTVTKVFNAVRVLAESLGISDAAIKDESYLMAESLGIIDTTVLDQTKVIANSLDVSDSMAHVIVFLRVIADTLGLTDAGQPSVSQGFPRTLADVIGIADTMSKTEVKSKIIADVIGLSDSVLRTMAMFRTIAEALSLSDTMSPGQLIVLADSISMSDSMSRTQVQLRTFTDDIGITDDVNKIMSYIRSETDNISISDTLIKVSAILRTVNDNVNVSDVMGYSHVVAGAIKAAWAFMIIRQSKN